MKTLVPTSAASALLLSALLSLVPMSPGVAAGITGIARVVDGDTLDIEGQRVRLEGIDAPETAQTCTSAAGEPWPCGRDATRVLVEMIRQKSVNCEDRGQDKYGRMLGVCFIDGENINESMVKNGYAWAFVKYSTEFVDAEEDARTRKIGVWAGTAQPPWDYRHGSWATAENTAPSGCAIKGNISSGGHIYHMPWSPWYDKVRIDAAKGERWFCSEAEATAAGWRAAMRF